MAIFTYPFGKDQLFLISGSLVSEYFFFIKHNHFYVIFAKFVRNERKVNNFLTFFCTCLTIFYCFVSKNHVFEVMVSKGKLYIFCD